MQSELRRNPKFFDIAFQLALLGATDAQLADAFGVSIKTIEYWKRTDTEFRKTLLNGKLLADSQQAASLFKCGLGYDYEEDVVVSYRGHNEILRVRKHRPANPWAAYKWLSLRQRDHWHDTHSVDITNKNINANISIDLTDCSPEELKLLKRIALNAHPQTDESTPVDGE